MHVFRDLFVAAVEESDIRVGRVDDFPIQLENQPKHAMGGRVRWTHVQHHALANEVVRLRMVMIGSAGGAGDGVGRLDFLNSVTHA